MKITGCDIHTRYQQIAMLDDENGEADAFYRGLSGPVRVGIEATGPIQWFQRLLAELHRAQVGCAYVLDAARWGRLRTAGSHARQPGSHPGERKFTVRPIERLAPPSDRGV